MVSDDAGQFNVGQQALCWVHTERLVHKLETFTDQQRVAQQHVRGLIWWFYADLKAYRLAPTQRRRSDAGALRSHLFNGAQASSPLAACCNGCTPTKTNC